jgi:hypothetical protein
MRSIFLFLGAYVLCFSVPAWSQEQTNVGPIKCTEDANSPGANVFANPQENAFLETFACPNAFIQLIPKTEAKKKAEDDEKRPYDLFEGVFGGPFDRVIDRRGLNAQIDISTEASRLGISYSHVVNRKFLKFKSDQITSDLPYQVKLTPKVSVVLDGESGAIYGFEEPVSGVRFGGTVSFEFGQRRSVDQLRKRFDKFRKSALMACKSYNDEQQNSFIMATRRAELAVAAGRTPEDVEPAKLVDCTNPTALNDFAFASSEDEITDHVTFKNPKLYEALTNILWGTGNQPFSTFGFSGFYTPLEAFKYRDLTPVEDPAFRDEILDPNDVTGRKELKEERKRWEVSTYGGFLPHQNTYIGATLEVGEKNEIQKDRRDVQLCPPAPSGVPVSSCIKSNIAAPEQQDYVILGLEGRFRFATRLNTPDIGFAPRVTHNFEDGQWGFDMPVYVPFGKDDALKGGVRVTGEAGGGQPDDWVASIFLGASLDIVK